MLVIAVRQTLQTSTQSRCYMEHVEPKAVSEVVNPCAFYLMLVLLLVLPLPLLTRFRRPFVCPLFLFRFLSVLSMLLASTLYAFGVFKRQDPWQHAARGRLYTSQRLYRTNRQYKIRYGITRFPRRLLRKAVGSTRTR